MSLEWLWCQTKQNNHQTVEFLVIWDAMTLMWHHYIVWMTWWRPYYTRGQTCGTFQSKFDPCTVLTWKQATSILFILHIYVHLITHSRVLLLCDSVLYGIAYSATVTATEHQSTSINSQKTLHISPSRASYGVSIVIILEKTDHVITAPHCMCMISICFVVVISQVPVVHFTKWINFNPSMDK